MTQLASAVDAVDKLWTIDTLPPSPYVQVDDELVEISATFPEQIYEPTQELRPPKIRVRRGVGGTTAASHAENAELVAVYSAGGTGVPAFVHYSEEDPGAVGAGHLWINGVTDPPAVFIRNGDDSAWTSLQLAYLVEDTPSASVSVFDGAVSVVAGLGTSASAVVSVGAVVSNPDGTSEIGAAFRAYWDGTWYGMDIYSPSLGTAPVVALVGLPAVDPEVANALWNDGGTLKVSAG